MTTIWGLDLGTTSVGFSVVRTTAGAETILRMGVRIFPEGVEEKDKAPRNRVRREKRLVRRQLRRRRWRRRHLRTLLAETGFLPPEEGKPVERSALMASDPYALRAEGLHRALTPHELGRAILHLAKRRGFVGSRKFAPSETERAKEEGETKAKIATLKAEMGERRLGEFLAAVQEPERRRERPIGRDMVEGEFEALLAAQRPHHAALRDPDFVARLRHVVFFLRPTFFRRSTIGHCDLEPTQERALKADWRVQQFELLQLVNALRLERGNQRGLDEAERAKAVDFLSARSDASWAQLRKHLGLAGEAFTHERGAKRVKGNATEAALAKAIGPFWTDLAPEMKDRIRHEIAERLHNVEYRRTHDGARLEIRTAAEIAAERAALADHAERIWDLPRPQAEVVSQIEGLPDGHGRHALASIARLMPYLEQGQPYMTARDAAYPEHRESTAPLDRLPEPSDADCSPATASLRNPTVLRTLHELQKVVNNLLAVHGRPDFIRVELARDLKRPAAERREIESDNKLRERKRKAAAEALKEKGRPVTREAIERWMLWMDQGCRCAYTGEAIGESDLFGNTDGAQVDHIFPLSRSFDDSYANKVVCTREANRRKQNKTPAEAFDAATLKAIVDRLSDITTFPTAKIRRIQKSGLEPADSDAFTNRQLTDTQFIARAARGYLAQLYGGGDEGMRRVQVSPGRATAHLRRGWGLSVRKLVDGEVVADGTDAAEGKKARDDHRHHAVDALVVALTGPGEVHALSRAYAESERTGRKAQIPLPWPSLHADAARALGAAVVSYRVQRKLSGRLHEETILGRHEHGGRTVYVKRKPVAALTARELKGAIRDDGVRHAIEAAIREAGDLKKAAERGIRLPRRDGTPGPLIRRVRLEMERETGIMRVHPTKNMHAELGPGTSHHIAVYKGDNGSVSYEVVTKRDAATRVRRGDAPVCRTHPALGRLFLSLCPNDMIMRTDAHGRSHFVVVRKVNAEGRIFYKPHWMTGVPEKEVSLSPRTLVADGWQKVAVDPIGRVRPAHD